jgi:hypothetical protein
MNIGQFAKKPELIKIEITDPEIVKNYDGVVSFWILDSVDINTYFEFYKSQADSDGEKLNAIMRSLILNEQGKSVIEPGHILPIDLALAALGAINDRLGKSRTKESDPTTGAQPT